MKVQYEFNSFKQRRRSIKLFRVVGTKEWQTYNDVAVQVGRDREGVIRSIESGRLPHIPASYFLVIGGPCDGQWMDCETLARITGIENADVFRRARDFENLTITFRTPDPRRVESAKKMHERLRVVRKSPSRSLDGVSSVASMFTKISFQSSQGM